MSLGVTYFLQLNLNLYPSHTMLTCETLLWFSTNQFNNEEPEIVVAYKTIKAKDTSKTPAWEKLPLPRSS